MDIQARTDNSNSPFIRSGTSYATTGATINQNAGRLIDLAPYTVMARLKVAVGAVTPVLITGDGTVTAFALSSGPIPITGDWNLECIEAVAEGGIFKLEDPNGVLIEGYLPMTPGALAATTFDVAGMTFIITDGAADFVVGDKFTLAIAAASGYVPLAADGVGGAQSVAGIYHNAAIPVANIVAGDVLNNIIIVGGLCTVTKEDVVVDGGGAVTDLLPSGKTVEEELALLGMFLEDVIAISGFENS